MGHTCAFTNQDQLPNPIQTQTTPRRSHLTTPVAEIATDTAKVTLAGALISRASTGSDVRFEKVAALRHAIEAGSYNVPSSALAEKLIASMRSEELALR